MLVGVVIYFTEDFILRLKLKSEKLNIIIFIVLLLMIFSNDISQRLVTGTKNLYTSIKNGKMIESPREFRYIIVNNKEAQFLEGFDKDLNNYMDHQYNHAFINMSFYIIFSSLVNPRLDFHKFYEYRLVKDEDVFNLYPDYKKKLLQFIITKKPVIIYSKQFESDNNIVKELIFSNNQNLIKYKTDIIYSDNESNDYLSIMIPEEEISK